MESDSNCPLTVSSDSIQSDSQFIFVPITLSTSADSHDESNSRSASISSSFTSISTPSSDEFRDNIILILFAKDVSISPQSIPIDQQLKCTLKTFRYFSDIDPCTDYIRMVPQYERVFVIAGSKEEAKALVQACNKCSWFKGVYVLEQIPSDILSPDVRIHYFDDWNTLQQELNADVLSWRRQSFAFRFFAQTPKTIRDVTAEAAAFMWSQILLGVLKEMPTSQETINDMLDMCADYYRDNPSQLRMIAEFRSHYHPDQAIRWYTRDCFLYHRLNAALRTEDIDALLLFCPFLVDLCDQIEEAQRHYSFSEPIVTVYHGQRMAMEEIEKLQKNKGNLVSTNAFWSSSLGKEVASIYAGEGQHRSNRWSVLIQIDVDTSLKSIVFAPVDQMSPFKDEREVLFSLSAVFKIQDVYKDPDLDRWCVHLEGTDEGRDNLTEYGHLLRHDTEETNIHVIFGGSIMTMGKYDKACAYFRKLAKRLPAEDIDVQAAIREKHGRALFFLSRYRESIEMISEGLALYKNVDNFSTNPAYLRLQFNLANVYMFTGRFDEALELYHQVLGIQQELFHPDHRHIAESYCGLSWAYQRKLDYKLALDYCERALDIFQRTLPPNHPTIYKVSAALGGLLDMLGQWNTAHTELKRSLDTCRRFLPNDHPYIADLLRNIGDVHVNRGEIHLAMSNFQSALEIRERHFPNGHIKTASTLTVMADLYRLRKEYDKAIEIHARADEMQAHFLPPGTRIDKHYLALVYLDMGDSSKAIELFQLTYEIRSAQYGQDSSESYRTLSCLGTAYSHHGNYPLALQTFEKALVGLQKCFPEGHPDIGVVLHHMGSNFRRMQNYEQALECYQDSLKIFQKFMDPTHPEIKLIKEKMQLLRKERKVFEKTLSSCFFLYSHYYS